MSDSTNPMDALNALMEERARYEQWLSQLEVRKGTTPTHVFDRVRKDYDARLNKVLDTLAGRATELQATASTLAEKVAALYENETTLRDERAEAELRAMVGEFSLDHAREVMQRCDEAIATLGAERATVGAELGRVQEILSVAVRPTTPPVGETPIVPIEALAPPIPAPAPAAERVPTPPRQVTPRPSPAKPAPASAFDELAFLQSVVDKPVQPSMPVDGPRAAAEPRPEIRSPSPAPARPAIVEPIDVEPAIVSAAPSRRNAAPTPVLTSAPLIEKEGQDANSALTPGSIPAFLKDVPTEQIKTLKCQECGTMNYPTEWYCERCGGELAAM